MKNHVSVIIPNYNCLNYLPKAIDSVMQQQNTSFELIVVDDGSTDGSLEWLNKLQATSNQIHVLKNNHMGVVEARNLAIEHASGEFIAFLDADDYWYENKLKPQLDFMREHPSCGLSFTNYQHVDSYYTPIIDCFSYWPEFEQHKRGKAQGYNSLHDPINTLLIANVIGTSTVMVRKTVFDKVNGFDNTLQSASDWDCWLKIALVSDIGFSDKITMDYLMRADSISAKRYDRLDAMQKIITKFISLEKVRPATKRKAVARLFEAYGEICQSENDYNAALLNTVNAFKNHPNKRYLKQLFSNIKQIIKKQVHVI